MHGSAYDPEGLLISYWMNKQFVVAFGLQPCVYHDVQRLEPSTTGF
jgi:hypothetical protein